MRWFVVLVVTACPLRDDRICIDGSGLGPEGAGHLASVCAAAVAFAAAAVKAQAEFIVTSNLKDFRVLPEGLEACSPDDFLLTLLRRDGHGVVDLLRRQAEALRKPPVSFEQRLGGLETVVPGFVSAVRRFRGIA